MNGCTTLPLVSQFLNLATKTPMPGYLFFDDFSERDSGWDLFNDAIGMTEYVSETYQILVKEPNTDLFANPNKNFRDVIIEVKAQRLAGPQDNSFGIICRYRDEKNFYTAQISNDGYAGILRMKDGEYTLLGQESMIPAPSILGGSSVNIIHMECVGRSLSLVVNGKPVDAREDDSFETGDVGLIAGSFGEAGVHIAFDDFSVAAP